MSDKQWCTKCGSYQCAEPEHELDNDLPAYLVFLILANLKRLKQVAPDHILVKAVQAALDKEPAVNPDQSAFDL